MDINRDSAFNAKLDRMSAAAGWTDPERKWPGPPRFVPAIWHYADAKALLDHAGEFMTAEEAERRNLNLLNPGGPSLPTTQSIITAYQMVLPGEKAPSHRHAPAALRCIVDTEPGIYTIVDGVALEMLPGDVLLTPAFCWHGHANEGTAKAYFIDFLDVPLVARMGAFYGEPYPGHYQKPDRIDHDHPFWTNPSKVFGPERKTGVVEILGGVMPTIALHLIRLAKGEHLDIARTPVSAVYSVITGPMRFVTEGEAGKMDEVGLRGDNIAVPGWYDLRLEAQTEDATLLRVSDEPVFKRLGLLNGASH